MQCPRCQHKNTPKAKFCEYLRRWKMETGKFFDGVTATYTRIGTPANRSSPFRVQGSGPQDSLIARIMDEGSGPGMAYGRGR
jgi:hypothetical protein